MGFVGSVSVRDDTEHTASVSDIRLFGSSSIRAAVLERNDAG
ncbi:MAG: hypothetical protein K0R28_5521 [Paenibacillus sp.]|nr:hypothetical protein [Paenibacillus sp.]